MTASYAIGRTTVGSYALPEIVASLPGSESDFSRELDDRVRRRFPIGSSEDKLIYYLTTGNFTPEWRERDDQNAGYLMHRGLFCTQFVRIFWRADAAGSLTSVGGAYQSQCAM